MSVYALFARALGDGREERFRVFVASMLLGPTVIAFVLEWILRAFPGGSDAFYVGATSLVFVLVLLARRPDAALFRDLPEAAREYGSAVRAEPGGFFWAPLLLVAAFFAGTAFWFSFRFPLIENDPSDYLNMAQLFYEQRTLANYPFAGDPAVNHGFYNVTAHPLGYPLSILWVFLLRGSALPWDAFRAVAPIFLSFLGLTLAFCLPRRLALAGAGAAVLVLGSMAAWAGAAQREIDSFRLLTFFLPFLFLDDACRRGTPFAAIWVGVLAAAGTYAHLSGPLVVPLLVGSALLGGSGALRNRIAVAFLLAVPATATGILQPLRNWLATGNALPFKPWTFFEPMLHVNEHSKILGGFDDTKFRRWEHFSLFVRPPLYGWGGPLALGAAILSPRVLWREPVTRQFILATLGYLFLAELGTALGSDAFLLNHRYRMVVMPLCSLVGCYGLTWGIARLAATIPERFRAARWRWIGRSAGTAVLAWAVAAVAQGPLSQWRWYAGTFGPGRDSAGGDKDAMKRATHTIYPLFAEAASLPVEKGALIWTNFFNLLRAHSRHDVLRDHDPRLKEAFHADSPEKAFAALRALGVRYAFFGDNYLDTVDGSPLGKLLEDRRFFVLKSDHAGGRLYRVADPGSAAVPAAPLREWGDGGWSAYPSVEAFRTDWIGEKDGLELAPTLRYRAPTSGPTVWFARKQPCGSRRVAAGSEVRARYRLHGHGIAHVGVAPKSPDREFPKTLKLNVPLAADEARSVTLAFRAPAELCALDLFVGFSGKGRVALDAVDVEVLPPALAIGRR